MNNHGSLPPVFVPFVAFMMVIHINYFAAEVPSNFRALLLLRKMDIKYATHQHGVALHRAIKSDAKARQKITLLFVITVKCFSVAVWNKK